MKSVPRFTPALVVGWVLLGIAAWFVIWQRERPPISETAKRSPQGQRPARSRSVIPPADVVRELEAGGDPDLQAAVSAWFAADPVSVRRWLEAKPNVGRLQAVLAQLARDIASSGQPAEALKWADRLQSGPERDRILFEIYATGRRYRTLTDEEIRAAPFPPRQIDDLLSGAADD